MSTLYAWARALEVSPTALLPSVEVIDIKAEVDAALAGSEPAKKTG